MRKWLAWAANLRRLSRLTDELKHVRATRAMALRTALDEHTEVRRLRARNEQLEALLLNPDTIKEQ